MKYALSPVSLAVLALALAGCSTPPPKALKEADLPAAFTAPVTKDSQVWPSTDWWLGFKNEELTALVTRARIENLDLAVATARVLQAQAQAGITRADLFPNIGLDAGASQKGVKAPGTWVTTNSYNVGLTASYELDFWGLARNNLRAANASLRSAEYTQQLVALTITADTANAYFTVLAFRERLTIARDNLESARRVLTITEAKTANGILSNLELSQQRAAVLTVEAALPLLEQQERKARYALALLLGMAPEGFDVKGESLTGISAPDVQPGVPSELLARRPDVAAAEANLASAHASVDAARALYFPQIGLTGAGGFASAALGSLFNPASMLYSVAGSLFQTIFDGGRIASQNDLARGRQQELVATYRKTVLSAFIDAESALGDVSSFREQDRLRTLQVAAAQEAYRISELQYREGITDLLAVLQSQQTLFTAQDTLVQVRLAALQSKVGLYRALGGGWTSSDAPMPAQEIDFEDRPDNAPTAEKKD